MNLQQSDAPAGGFNRREFLKQTVAGVSLAAAAAAFGQDASARPGMPLIQVGSYHMSRLILGSNPMLGYSHSSAVLSRLMSEYFTVENIGKLLEQCLALGVNTWQTSADKKVDQALANLRNSGRDIQWIFLANGPHLEDVNALKEIIRRNKPTAIVHHGQVTDRLWREGHVGKAYDFIKRVQDLGVMAGLSSHNPDVVRHVESEGWKFDFFMTSFYRNSRSRDELKAQLSEAPMGEVFLASDPPKMCAAIQAAQRPCLAFKILGAGRSCDHPEQVASAFEYAFRNIKRTDAAIVGMFPRFRDEASEDAGLTLRFANLSQ